MVQVLLRLHSHGTGCTFDWLKICAFTGDLFTRDQLDHKKIWATSCSKICANRAKILNGPVWMKCSVKFFNRLKIHQVPCECSLRITFIWQDISQSYISWISLTKCLKLIYLLQRVQCLTTLRYVGHFTTMWEKWIVARAIKIEKKVGQILIFPRMQSNKRMNRALKKSEGLGQLNFHARQVTL